MDLESFLSQGVSLISSFTPKVMVFLFLLCLIGEGFLISVPYLLEATWLIAGYQLSTGALSAVNLLLLVLAAQAGRQGGGIVLYLFSRRGGRLLSKYVQRLRSKVEANGSPPLRFFRRLNLLSPFSVALGRLVGMRLPLTLLLGARGKLKVLLLGTVLSSIAWDGVYITLGAVVGTTIMIRPAHLLLYSVAGVTLVYGLTLVGRRLMASFTGKRTAGMPEAR